MKDAIEIIKKKRDALKVDLVVAKNTEDEKTVVINRTSEHLDGLIGERGITSLLINNTECDIVKLNKAIESLNKVFDFHEDDWDNTLMFKSIIAVMIPFVPIDIRDKVEELI